MRYQHKTVGTKVLTTEIEYAISDDGSDVEVRICEATTLCWITKDDIERFNRELQQLITKHAI